MEQELTLNPAADTPDKPPRSAAQIEASRDNGAHSRGPKTPAGKAASSRNAVKHGFVAMNEVRGSFAQALDPLTAHYQPADPVEEELIGQMAFAQLALARYQSRHPGPHAGRFCQTNPRNPPVERASNP
jgi:hypothetical protein